MNAHALQYHVMCLAVKAHAKHALVIQLCVCWCTVLSPDSVKRRATWRLSVKNECGRWMNDTSMPYRCSHTYAVHRSAAKADMHAWYTVL